MMATPTSKGNFKVVWIDGRRFPKVAPNPAYPEGVDIEASRGAPGCSTSLRYPADRIGQYYVDCLICGTNALITMAGRRDDPRWVKLPCKPLAVA